MRLTLLFLALGLAGVAVPASAAERIFANGFEPCCTLGGTVTGLTGAGLVLHLSAGAVNEDKPIAAQGGAARLYTFSHSVPQGTAYSVSITTQPAGQNCTLTNAGGSMGTTPVDNIDATCVAGPAGLVWDDGAWDETKWQ